MLDDIFNENELISLLRQGDVNAFRMLYEKYGPRLNSFCTRFNFSPAERDDIVQETFVKIWEKRADIKTGTSFNAFVITIGKNLIYNQLRHEAYKKKYSAEFTFLSPKQINHDTEKDLQKLIDKTVNQLPDKCRQIYRRSRVDGFSNTEIAREMNIAKSTVENQINKALKKLRSTVESSGYSLKYLLFVSLAGYQLLT